jgi:hypothetical protein
MIPFTQPRDGELINLLQIVRVIDHPAGDCPEEFCGDTHETAGETISVRFCDGHLNFYSGEAAKIVKGGVLMNRKLYETTMIAALNPSNIVTPEGPGGRVM